MRYSKQVRPVSYLKANAAEMLSDLSESREPVLITQNGRARAVLVDVVSFEETRETLALLKILALGQREVDNGATVDARSAVAGIIDRLSASR